MTTKEDRAMHQTKTMTAKATAMTTLFCATAGLATLLAPAAANATTQWLAAFSEEQPAGQFCPGWNERVTRTHCWGAYCDNIELYCAELTGAQGGYDDWKLSGWTSEESSPISCTFSSASDFGAITGMKCTGSYCDNIKVECGHPESGHSLSDCFWTPWVSEEGGGMNYFSGAQTFEKGARAVQCGGEYCDSMRYLACVEN
jgi:hypothetical protein